jgi:hypothetical protein
MENQKLNCELSLAEWNVVLQALNGMPFGQVANIIPNVQTQLNNQLKPAEQPVE